MAVLGTYDANGNVATVDGRYVPPDLRNKDYRELMDAVAEGDTIDPYVPPAPTGEAVDLERERRIAMPLAVTLPGAGAFTINMDGDSIRNIGGLATVGVLGKISASAATTPFRDFNNAMHNLTADDLIAMGLAAQARVGAIYAKSWAVKAMVPVPADYQDDKYW